MCEIHVPEYCITWKYVPEPIRKTGLVIGAYFSIKDFLNKDLGQTQVQTKEVIYL